MNATNGEHRERDGVEPCSHEQNRRLEFHAGLQKVNQNYISCNDPHKERLAGGAGERGTGQGRRRREEKQGLTQQRNEEKNLRSHRETHTAHTEKHTALPYRLRQWGTEPVTTTGI